MTEEEIAVIKGQMAESYYITETGMFSKAKTVDDIMTELMEVFKECLDFEIDKDSYVEQVIRAACQSSGYLVQDIAGISDFDEASDLIMDAMIDAKPAKQNQN